MARRKLGEAWMTARQAAEVLGLPIEVVRALVRQGELRRVNPKGHPIIPRAEIDAFIRRYSSGVAESMANEASGS